MAGFINIDKNADAPYINLVCNLDNIPWPFKDESVNEIVMSQ